MEKIKGYKTAGFFCLSLVVSLAGLAGFAGWEPTVEQLTAISSITSLVGIILRSVTTTPVFSKE